eukprot:1156580-Pelagomonas_calceolata.AAC.1
MATNRVLKRHPNRQAARTRTDQLVFVAIDTGTSAISVKRQTGTGQPVEKVGNSPDSFRDTGHCLQPGENKAAMQGLMFTWK